MLLELSHHIHVDEIVHISLLNHQSKRKHRLSPQHRGIKIWDIFVLRFEQENRHCMVDIPAYLMEINWMNLAYHATS